LSGARGISEPPAPCRATKPPPPTFRHLHPQPPTLLFASSQLAKRGRHICPRRKRERARDKKKSLRRPPPPPFQRTHATHRDTATARGCASPRHNTHISFDPSRFLRIPRHTRTYDMREAEAVFLTHTYPPLSRICCFVAARPPRAPLFSTNPAHTTHHPPPPFSTSPPNTTATDSTTPQNQPLPRHSAAERTNTERGALPRERLSPTIVAPPLTPNQARPSSRGCNNLLPLNHAENRPLCNCTCPLPLC
jgi:hypothetical protein